VKKQKPLANLPKSINAVLGLVNSKHAPESKSVKPNSVDSTSKNSEARSLPEAVEELPTMQKSPQ